MQVVDDLSRVALRHETVLTIGAFDGVHRGHQALIRAVVDRARATCRLAALITFHPHPALVLAEASSPQATSFYLSTPGEKLVLLEDLGLDLVALLPFDRDLADTSARDFMRSVADHLHTRELWVGPDFALGRRKEGDVARLRDLGGEMGYDLTVFRPVVDVANGQATISSSRIRALLREGRVEQVAEMLGRFFAISGEVVAGAHRGRRLGFPTANLEVRAERALPADGVYAVNAVLGDERYPAVANVGVRPSFDNGPRVIETHILDFDGDIYGCDLKIEFVARLRDEQRFSTPDDLVAQIRRDGQVARSILEPRVVPGPASPTGFGGGSRGTGTPCPYSFEEVEHTADRALRVWGRDLPDLFVGAALGMAGMMADLDGLIATRWREVRLEALDRETLLVAWLNELLFMTESEDLLFVEFRCKSVTDTALVAWVGGTPGRVTGTPVKAATFHALELVQDGAGWSTMITFDA